MTEKEFNDLFKKIAPPDFILPNEKAQLRRDLMNSSLFTEESQWLGIFQLKYLVGAAATIAIAALFVVVSLIPQQISAKELIKDIGAAYDLAQIAGKVHYLRFLYQAFERKPVEQERWVYSRGGKFRMLNKDTESGEVLSHSIIDGDRTFSPENSPIEVRYKIRQSGSAAERDEEQVVRKNLSIVITPVESSNTTPDSQRMMQAFVMTDGFDYDAFERRTPVEIVEDLMKSPEVVYLGSEFDAALGQKLDVLEKRSEAGSFSLKLEFPEKYFGQVCWFCERLEDDEISIRPDSPFGSFLSENNIASDLAQEQAEAVETIKVFSDSKKIYQITLSIREDGKEKYHAEKIFLDDLYLDHSPELFDPKRYGLMLQQQDDRAASRFESLEFLKRRSEAGQSESEESNIEH